ncbi:ABC transporter substrate-binding protein [Nocardioides carbamazepini]|uniref:ABC transporter substrate-binding protein n=1 Tax=Nocardioides carbamazepini TaxID=2854259 RepID=UPI002149EA3F|nr:ABC transporter substrate-binding protein [Nocardioides carbamazepini]MCR1781079.1 ABC transporter substrate-binding protein [Nocardioides carbamazepini]
MSSITDSVIAFSKNSDVRALMCNPPQNIFRIVVPEDSDIESVEDLEGRTLGIAEAGGGEEPIVNASLEDAGLARDQDVRIQPIGDAGPASLNAILEGKVDAYAGSYPDISTLSADGRLVTRDITPAAYNAIPGDCMITTVEHLENGETRKQLVGLARAWAKGAVYAAAHPEEATQMACAQVPQECQDMAFATKYTADTIALSGVTSSGGPFGAVPVDAWQTTIDVLSGSGAVDGDLSADELGGGTDVESFVNDYSDFDAADLGSATP